MRDHENVCSERDVEIGDIIDFVETLGNRQTGLVGDAVDDCGHVIQGQH